MRVFLGLTEVGNCVHSLSVALRALGVATFTVVSDRAWAYPESSYDVVLTEHLGAPPSGNSLREKLLLLRWRLRFFVVILRAFLTCDTFIFLFGSAFRPNRADYPLLKRMGKRIVSIFVGDDSRYWYAYTQEAELLGIDRDIRPYLDESLKDRRHDFLSVKLAAVQAAERNADLILALPDSAQLQRRPYKRINIPIDLATVDCHIPDRDVPIVVHAPSVRGIKGTDRVLIAIDQLKAEGIAFEFRLLERVSRKELLAALRDSDIVVDQIYSETVATLALEGMASGNAVLARHLRDRMRIPADCPVVNVNAETLADRLREVILDRGLRRRLAEAGRPYVAKYHAHVVVARQILDWLEQARCGTIVYDFNPTFFRDHFTMSPAIARREAIALREEPLWLRLGSARSLDGVRFLDEPDPANAAAT